jgi:hypothetical protein
MSDAAHVCACDDLPDLLDEARIALDRARTISSALTQCETFLKEPCFNCAFQVLDASLSAYPIDPTLLSRRRNIEEQRNAFKSGAIIRMAMAEAQWLLEQDRPDLAFQFLSNKMAEFPAETELRSRRNEIEPVLLSWESSRQIQSALNRAFAWEVRERWRPALIVLEEALQSHPASQELATAARRVKQKGTHAFFSRAVQSASAV